MSLVPPFRLLANCSAVEQPLVPLVSARRGMQQRAVVPHHQHLRFPFVAILKFLPRLPLVELYQKRLRLLIRNSLEADDVAQRPEKAQPPGFAMLPNQSMALRQTRGFGGPSTMLPPLSWAPSPPVGA